MNMVATEERFVIFHKTVSMATNAFAKCDDFLELVLEENSNVSKNYT